MFEVFVFESIYCHSLQSADRSFSTKVAKYTVPNFYVGLVTQMMGRKKKLSNKYTFNHV